MAGVVVAPWLETKPSDFAAASEAGSRLGLEERGQDIQQQQAIAAQQEANARIQQGAAEIAANAQAQAQKVAAAREIAANKVALQTQIAARKFQQQQAYQQAIAGGMDPIQAMMVHGPSMGTSMTGVGQLGLLQARDRMASLPPKMVADPNDPKRTLGVIYAGNFHPAPAPRSVSTKGGASAGAQARLKAAIGAVAAATKIGLPEGIKAAQERLDKIAEEVDNPDGGDETGDESGGAAAPQNESDPLGLFTSQ